MVRCTYTTGYYSTRRKNGLLPSAVPWMDSEGIVQNEASQTERDKALSLIFGISTCRLACRQPRQPSPSLRVRSSRSVASQCRRDPAPAVWTGSSALVVSLSGPPCAPRACLLLLEVLLPLSKVSLHPCVTSQEMCLHPTGTFGLSQPRPSSSAPSSFHPFALLL